MGLAAFTNAPGKHFLREVRTGRQRGAYYGNRDVNEIVYTETYDHESAAKWYPTPGYAGCTDWAREVVKVVKDEPAQARRFVLASGLGYPNDVQIDLTIDDHISRSFPMGTTNIPDPGYDNAHNESITKALNNLTQHYAGIGADLAQARQTCSEFARVALRAGGFLTSMKRGDFSGAAGYLAGVRGKYSIKAVQKSLADTWLAYSYGWKPLASDLHEAQQLAHAALLKPVPVMAHGSGKSSDTTVVADYYGFHLNKLSESSHRTYLEANVTNPTLYLLSQAGLINPLSIAWETVPFSFVVDWFVPIGATLQAITAGVGLEFNAGWTSTHINRSLEIHRNLPAAAPPGTSYYQWVNAGSYREQWYEFRRQCHTGFPPPKLYADVTPYSSERALNALALVRNLV